MPQKMIIGINDIQFCYSLLDADDIKNISTTAGCSQSLVRAVGRGDRTNDTVEYLIYEKVKAKAQKGLLICETIEKQNSGSLRSIGKEFVLYFEY